MNTYVCKRDMYKNIDYNFICNNKTKTKAKANKVETTQMPINRRMDKVNIPRHTRWMNDKKGRHRRLMLYASFYMKFKNR